MNDTNYGIVLGGLLSSILLILYTCLVGYMIINVIKNFLIKISTVLGNNLYINLIKQ